MRKSRAYPGPSVLDLYAPISNRRYSLYSYHAYVKQKVIGDRGNTRRARAHHTNSSQTLMVPSSCLNIAR
jgi:hypothetical protein